MDKSKYLKDKQPPAVDDEGMVKVDVDVDITRILVIDEERNIFSRNQFYEKDLVGFGRPTLFSLLLGSH